MSDDVEVLMNVAVLGEQVDNFWRTDIGRFLDARIQEERAEALEALVIVDASDAKQVREAQNKVWRVTELKGWIAHAISDGLKAKMVLEDRIENGE